MTPREVVDVLTDDDAEMLEAHPVDALVNGCDSESTIREIGRPFQTFSEFALA